MRTSAQKISPLYARIEKEISRRIDRAPQARNFTPIARSRRTALEAITLDLKFFGSQRNFVASSGVRTFFWRDRKKYFRSH
jgi:hypothetical protein